MSDHFPQSSPLNFAGLTPSLQDNLLLPDHVDYEIARGVWNAAVDVQPSVIIRPSNTEDVVAALAFARSHDLPVAVRSGGHSPAGYGTCHAGVVIDLSGMKALELDVQNKIARVQPGLTWAELANELHPHGLALTSGDTGSVGIGGLTLGGGIGWMVNKHGLTIDRLRSVEIVTADGEVLRASNDENSDLFWAIRGGGGNFGIVTSLAFNLHEGGMIYGGALAFPAFSASEIVQQFAQLAQQAPDELTTQLIIIAAPPAPFIPAEAHGKPMVLALFCYTGDHAEGEKAIAPFREIGHVVADLVGPMPYPALFKLSEAGEIRGLRHACRTLFLNEMTPELADALIGETMAVFNAGTMIQLRSIGGAARRTPVETTAFVHRDKPFLLMLENYATTPEGDEAARVATLRIWEAVQAHATGTYVNFLGIHEADQVSKAYCEQSHRRLAAIKQKYDPQNLFRRNGNIAPSAA